LNCIITCIGVWKNHSHGPCESFSSKTNLPLFLWEFDNHFIWLDMPPHLTKVTSLLAPFCHTNGGYLLSIRFWVLKSRLYNYKLMLVLYMQFSACALIKKLSTKWNIGVIDRSWWGRLWHCISLTFNLILRFENEKGLGFKVEVKVYICSMGFSVSSSVSWMGGFRVSSLF